MIGVGEILADPDLSRAFSVLRLDRGALANEGEWVEGSTTTIPMVGVIHPAKASQVALLPEGTRITDTIAVYTTSELIAEDGEGASADIIVWRGRQFRVVARRDWSDQGYWQAFAEGIKPWA